MFIDKNQNEVSLDQFVNYWSLIYRSLNRDSYPDAIYNYFLVDNYSEFTREKLMWMGAWKWNMLRALKPTGAVGILDKYEFKKGWKQNAKKEYSIYDGVDIEELKTIHNMTSKNERPCKTNRVFEVVSDTHRVGMVNAVFLLHIADRLQYPIYDQFVHRALDYLYGNVSIEFIRFRPPHKQTAYKHIYEYMFGYKVFFDQMLIEIEHVNLKESEKLRCKRDLDKALWAFGRWLRKSE